MFCSASNYLDELIFHHPPPINFIRPPTDRDAHNQIKHTRHNYEIDMRLESWLLSLQMLKVILNYSQRIISLVHLINVDFFVLRR